MNWKFWKRKSKVLKTISDKDGDELTEWELQIIQQAKCPDCESELLKGPHGGMSQNIYCANDASCDSRFNYVGGLWCERISDRRGVSIKEE